MLPLQDSIKGAITHLGHLQMTLRVEEALSGDGKIESDGVGLNFEEIMSEPEIGNRMAPMGIRSDGMMRSALSLRTLCLLRMLMFRVFLLSLKVKVLEGAQVEQVEVQIIHSLLRE
jgi:hypothetical protein